MYCYCTPYNTSKDAALCLVLSEIVFTLHKPNRSLVLLTDFNIFSPANPMLSVPHILISMIFYAIFLQHLNRFTPLQYLQPLVLLTV